MRYKSRIKAWFAALATKLSFNHSKATRNRIVMKEGIVDFFATRGKVGRHITMRSLYVNVPSRGAGHANRILGAILKAADHFGWVVRIKPESYGLGEKPSTTRLIRWYQSWGFRWYRGSKEEMGRAPRRIRTPRRMCKAA